MKPYQYTLIILLLISAQLLPGCTENQTTQPIDTDGDGYNNTIDLFPNDPLEWQDTDQDGIGDNTDIFPNNPNEWQDTDQDGIGDNTDYYPNDTTRWYPPNIQSITSNNTQTTINNTTIDTILLGASYCNITITENTTLKNLTITGDNNILFLSQNHSYTLNDTGNNNTIRLHDETDPILKKANRFLQTIQPNNDQLKNYAESLTQTCSTNNHECIITTIYRKILETYTITTNQQTTPLQNPQETMQTQQGTHNDITLLLISLYENLNITTYLVLADTTIYPYIPSLDTTQLWNHIQNNIYTYIEAQWNEPIIQNYQETLSIPSLQLRYYGGETNSTLDPYHESVTIDYHIESNHPLHMYVIPNQNELYNIAQGQPYTHYSEYEKTALISILYTIELDSYGGFVFVNEGINTANVTVDFTFTFNTIFDRDYSLTNISLFSHDGQEGIFLDPMLGTYGFPGYTENFPEDFIIYNVNTKSYTIYD